MLRPIVLQLPNGMQTIILLQILVTQYIISGHDLQPTDENIQAIKNAPAPQDVTQLKTFWDSQTTIVNFCPIYLHPGSLLQATVEKHKMVLGG